MTIDDYTKETDGVQTPDELIESTLHTVEGLLKQEFPDYLKFTNGSFTICRGSTQVIVTVRPFTNTETVVECMAHVVSGATITTELLHFLLRKNSELHFGGFGLMFDDTITFSHSVSGINLEGSVIRDSINAVAIIADYYDDEIVKMAGGKRAADIFELDGEMG